MEWTGADRFLAGVFGYSLHQTMGESGDSVASCVVAPFTRTDVMVFGASTYVVLRLLLDDVTSPRLAAGSGGGQVCVLDKLIVLVNVANRGQWLSL
jgi:hypothetical protein